MWDALRAVARREAGPGRDLMIRWLVERRPSRIGRFLRVVVRREGRVDAWILDELFGGFLHRVGDEWRKGRLRIGHERAATREVAETTYGLLAALERGGGEIARAAAPVRKPAVAIAATVESDQHVLGSLLVRLALAQRGWRVEQLGTGVPVTELLATQRALRASLVCVSFSLPRGAAEIRRFLEVAEGLADPCRPFALLVGGSAAQGVHARPRDGRSFTHFAMPPNLVALHDWMERHFPRPRPLPPPSAEANA